MPKKIGTVILITFLVTFLLFSGNVLATTPIVTEISPAPGEVVTTSPTNIFFKVEDPDEIDGRECFIKVNGVSINALVNYPIGHWEEDGGNTYWVIEDCTQAVISGTADLKDGLQKIEIAAKDRRGIFPDSYSDEWDIMVAAPPTFSSQIPASGAAATGLTQISVQVADNTQVDLSSIVLSLDGNPVPHSYDPLTKVVSYKSPTPLAVSSHTVSITAKDTFNNIGTVSWMFSVINTNPELNLIDAGKTIITASNTFKVSASCTQNIDSTSALLEIDGKPIPTTFTNSVHNPYIKGNLWGSASDLLEGPHTLKATISDILGNKSIKEWSFNVAKIPIIGQQTPANESSINSVSTLISATISNINDLAFNKDSITMSVDNLQVSPTISEINGTVAVSYYAVNLKDLEYHTVSVTVANPAGGSITGSWRFNINVKGEMVTTAADCGSCHALNSSKKYIHRKPPFRNDGRHCHYTSNEPKFCGYCHNNPIAAQDSQAQNCTYCHTKTPNVYKGKSGDQVVNRQVNISSQTPYFYYGNVLVHDIFPKHSVNKGECNTNCHSVNLTIEHNRSNKQGIKMSCTTCHQSTDPKVKAAIVAKNKDCSACHQGHHISNISPECQICHNPKIDIEHISGTVTLGKGYSCVTCHESTNPEVKAALASRTLSCSSCHSEFHGSPLQISVPLDIPLLSGFKWSTPISADYIIGEISMPLGYEAGRYIISNRRNDVTFEEVWYFYHQALTANGWVLITQPPTNGQQTFTAEYQKGQRYLYIKNIYRVEAPTGYRIEIWYK